MCAHLPLDPGHEKIDDAPLPLGVAASPRVAAPARGGYGARRVLINIIGSPDMGLEEVDAAATTGEEAVNADANIIFGAIIDENMSDELKVTIIATGFDTDGPNLLDSEIRPAPVKDEPKPRPDPETVDGGLDLFPAPAVKPQPVYTQVPQARPEPRPEPKKVDTSDDNDAAYRDIMEIFNKK